MSYFAKPNFIVYDEWFDNDFKKTIPNDKNKKIANISKTHDFFYEKSNFKVGGSENNLEINIKVNREELFNNYNFDNNLRKDNSFSNKKFLFFQKLTKNKLKFNISKRIIYSLSIFSFVFILGLILFFISQSKKNESYKINNSALLEKEF